MGSQKQVGIGIIGAGFLAETRGRCYGRISGVQARIVAVADVSSAAAARYAERYGVPRAVADYREVLGMPEVDVVDLCVPNHLHRVVAEEAAAAGKHVICAKPLTAYVGQDLPAEATDAQIAGRDRRRMLAVATADAQAMVDAVRRAGVQLMYAENWIYAPAIRRAESLLLSSGATILEMRGGECHSGSHTPFSKVWRYSGGGSLVRLGPHPIGAMLYLKRREGLARNGRPIGPSAVVAEVGDLTKAVASGDAERHWIAGGWQDVENWATVIITFDDGSRATAYASDAVLGGMESQLEVLASNCHLRCNLSPNNLLQAYTPDPGVFSGEYLQEKLETTAGWNTPMPNEDWTSGHQAMCQDMIAAVADGRPAEVDGAFGLEVARLIYTAYCAAAQGRRVPVSAE